MELTKQQLTEANAIVLRETGYAMTEQYLKKLASVLQYPQPTALTDEEVRMIRRHIGTATGMWIPEIDVRDSITDVLSRRTAESQPAEPSPAPITLRKQISEELAKLEGLE